MISLEMRSQEPMHFQCIVVQCHLEDRALHLDLVLLGCPFCPPLLRPLLPRKLFVRLLNLAAGGLLLLRLSLLC